MDPVKIPQNVYIEDRIVGPLTLRQTIMMTAGGGFSYVLYTTVVKSYGKPSLFLTILIWAPAAISAAFALVKVNDLSLTRILFLLLERMFKPSQRTFAPRKGITVHIRTSASPAKAAMENARKQEATKAEEAEKKIRELSPVLDTALSADKGQDLDTISGTAVTRAEGDVQDSDDPSHDEDHNLPPSPPQDRGKPSPPSLSDLSIFHDIFPPGHE